MDSRGRSFNINFNPYVVGRWRARIQVLKKRPLGRKGERLYLLLWGLADKKKKEKDSIKKRETMRERTTYLK